tara:strand:- start:9509 stop:9898 length:390 start_codon:yes stop_codon:yes gene_type:complete
MMPFYDFKCPDGCGYFHDVFVPLKNHGKQDCPSCGSSLTTVIGTIHTIGPMPSKPLVVKQIGREFESRAEFNQYQRENPGFEVLSANSSKWKQHKDLARERVEARAKKMGFRDHEERVAHRKKVKENVV